MLILQWRGHNSPCMQRGQSFFGVKTLSKTLFPQNSAKPQNVIKMCVTTQELDRKFEKTLYARWLHNVLKASEVRCLKHISGFGITFPHTPHFFTENNAQILSQTAICCYLNILYKMLYSAFCRETH